MSVRRFRCAATGASAPLTRPFKLIVHLFNCRFSEIGEGSPHLPQAPTPQHRWVFFIFFSEQSSGDWWDLVPSAGLIECLAEVEGNCNSRWEKPEEEFWFDQVEQQKEEEDVHRVSRRKRLETCRLFPPYPSFLAQPSILLLLSPSTNVCSSSSSGNR